MNILNSILAVISTVIVYAIGRFLFNLIDDALTNYIIGIVLMNVFLNQYQINDIKKKLGA